MESRYNRTRLFTSKENAKKFASIKKKEGKAVEMKEEAWIRQGIRRIEYRVNYEA